MLRVLVVDDSTVSRRLLRHMLESEAGITVVGEAVNGEDAVRKAARLHPDVITMDVYMPVMDGYEATRQIMSRTPKPIVMISAGHEPAEVRWSFRALEAGALTVLAKPTGPLSPQYEAQAAALVSTVRTMAEVKVVTRRAPRKPASASQPGPAVASFERSAAGRPPAGAPGASVPIELVAIGASTGGPAALAKILGGLGPDFHVPIMIVQHIAPGFERGLVDWLNSVSSLTAAVAEHDQPLRRGHVYVSPQDVHLGTAAGRIALSPAAPIGGHRPSATHLFQAVARSHGPRAIGVILTGIGSDGASGLADLHERGGLILAQDEASSVVFGMPKAAIELGLADQVVPLDAMARALRDAVDARAKLAG
jgi:two-component system chemotaxis response regulator CheB